MFYLVAMTRFSQLLLHVNSFLIAKIEFLVIRKPHHFDWLYIKIENLSECQEVSIEEHHSIPPARAEPQS